MPPVLLTLLFAACTPDSTDDTASESTSRLHAEGTAIVDESGNPIQLRGVALGGWNFLETWIPLMAHQEHGRALAIAEEQGVADQVRSAILSIGAGSGAEWRAALQVELEASLGAEAATAYLSQLEGFALLWDDSDLALREVLEDRFGREVRDELLDTFQRSWFTEGDVAWLAEQGFNVVRLPLGYRGLTINDSDDPLTELQYNELAFDRINDVLDWCETYGVYAVIDLQESPGGHNDYSGSGTLYDDAAMQQLTVGLWEELSSRFIDRDIVAAYSLLAEPMSAPSTQARDEMYDALIQAIRAQGDDHLLILHDGFDGMWSLPDPAEKGWEDVVYSTHLFEWGASSLEDYQAYLELWDAGFNTAQDLHQVPYYIGSFSTFKDEPWAYTAAEQMRRFFESQDWAWTLWTYKRLDDPVDAELFGDSSSWGLRGGVPDDFSRPDPQRQELEEIRAAYEGYQDQPFTPNEALLEALVAP